MCELKRVSNCGVPQRLYVDICLPTLYEELHLTHE
jgi:hypothetical protein